MTQAINELTRLAQLNEEYIINDGIVMERLLKEYNEVKDRQEISRKNIIEFNEAIKQLSNTATEVNY